MWTNGPTGRAIQRLRVDAFAHADAMTDGQLLESFVSRKDEAAFEVLVRRHGPMVLGVCRRILGNSHDAEDALQAVFLVLVRKAASISPPSQVANWLYGVAFRTANKARVMKATRRAKETHVRERPAPAAADTDLLWRDLQPLLDRELQALPDKYRSPIVLCDLEGKHRKEAARQLGWPEGTLSSRLAAGRRMLARRLSRRGVALSAVILPLALSHAVAEPLHASLAASTVQFALLAASGHSLASVGVSPAAAGLADAVVKSMLLVKLKLAAFVAFILIFAALGAGFSLDWKMGQGRLQRGATAAPAHAYEHRPPHPGATKSPPLPSVVAHGSPQARDSNEPIQWEVSHVWVLHEGELKESANGASGQPGSTYPGSRLPGIAIRLKLAGQDEWACIGGDTEPNAPPYVLRRRSSPRVDLRHYQQTHVVIVGQRIVVVGLRATKKAAGTL